MEISEEERSIVIYNIQSGELASNYDSRKYITDDVIYQIQDGYIVLQGVPFNKSA